MPDESSKLLLAKCLAVARRIMVGMAALVAIALIADRNAQYVPVTATMAVVWAIATFYPDRWFGGMVAAWVRRLSLLGVALACLSQGEPWWVLAGLILIAPTVWPEPKAPKPDLDPRGGGESIDLDESAADMRRQRQKDRRRG